MEPVRTTLLARRRTGGVRDFAFEPGGEPFAFIDDRERAEGWLVAGRFPEYSAALEVRMWMFSKWTDDFILLRLWVDTGDLFSGEELAGVEVGGQLVLGLARGECPIGEWDPLVCSCVRSIGSHSLCFVDLEEQQLRDAVRLVSVCRSDQPIAGIGSFIHSTDLVFQRADSTSAEVRYHAFGGYVPNDARCARGIWEVLGNLRDWYVPAEWGDRFDRDWFNWWDSGESCKYRRGPYPWVPHMCCDAPLFSWWR